MISNLLIDRKSSLSSAMEQIEANKQGFVIVHCKDNLLYGVLTDGDIRRAIIRGLGLKSSVEIFCNKDVHTISISSTFNDCGELFNKKSILASMGLYATLIQPL